MAVRNKTTALLLARSRGLCNICRADLAAPIGAEDPLTANRCHITADKPGGPRYDSALSPEQRDGYSNLILLCGHCHDKVDMACEHYTIALLHAIKDEHEAWCRERLTADEERRAIKGEILANAIDLVVNGLSLERWNEWTAQILGPSPYRWPEWSIKEFRLELRPRIEGVPWPESAAALELSSKMLVDAAVEFGLTYSEHSGPERRNGQGSQSTEGRLHEYLVCDSITQMVERYRGSQSHDWFERYLTAWDERLELGLVHMAKCANWFAEAVREHFDPRFRILEGAFLTEPTRIESGRNCLHVFSAAEKDAILRRGYVARKDGGVWELVRGTWSEPPEPLFGAEFEESRY